MQKPVFVKAHMSMSRAFKRDESEQKMKKVNKRKYNFVNRRVGRKAVCPRSYENNFDTKLANKPKKK